MQPISQELLQQAKAGDETAMAALTDYLSAGDLPSRAVERYRSCVSYMERFSDSVTPEAMALWETIQAAAGLE